MDAEISDDQSAGNGEKISVRESKMGLVSGSWSFMGYNPDMKYDLNELIQQADNADAESMKTAVMVMIADNCWKDHISQYIRYMTSLADNGDATGYILLGDAYLHGNGVRQNPQKAIECYNQAAQKGEMFGYECIGMMYYEGTSIPQDYEKAFYYLKKIKGPKSFCSLYTLGEMHRQGFFVTKSYRNACIYYGKVVHSKTHHPELDDYYWRSCFRLGQAYHYGMGVKEDTHKARMLISKATELFGKRENPAEDISLSDIETENMGFVSDKCFYIKQ